jgi:hypothetical protein
MNVGRALNRIWFDNGMIVIGSDLIVYNDMNSVQHTIERIKRDSDGLEMTFSQVVKARSEIETAPEGETK